MVMTIRDMIRTDKEIAMETDKLDRVQSEPEPTDKRRKVATDTHFRIIDENSSVLYHDGDVIARDHEDLKTKKAMLKDGVYVHGK